MPRMNVKYQLAKDESDTTDFLLQNIQDYQSISRKDTSFWKKIFQACVLIFIYFILSISLTFYQQWLYNTYDFHFPLGVVVCHLILKFMMAALIRCIRTCYTGHPQVKLPMQNIIESLAPPGIASGLDIGFSNWALSLITMSLYTMTKSTTIIFILAFSLIFKLEKKSWSLVGIVIMISGGLAMFTYKSTQFGVLGFILCIMASFSSGIRWTTAQLIMQKTMLGLRNPVDMIYYMQPWMLLSVIPVALWFEGPKVYKILTETNFENSHNIFTTTAAIIGGAVLAFVMEITEFLVVTYTSSLTLSISGILKEICTLILAYEWKGDQMSGLNFIGLLMCLGGIILHVVQKVLINKNNPSENLELQSNIPKTNGSKNEDSVDISAPLLTQKSTSLTNLLTADFSSNEEDEEDRLKTAENSSDILSNILQRREQY